MWSQKLITAVSEVKPSFLDISDRFVSALDRHGQVHVFDAASCERLHTCDTGSPEPATAVAVRPPHLLIGIEAKVELRTLQDDLPDGPLTRFTANVTCISAAQSGRLVGIGSADFTAKVIELDDGDCYVGEVALKGHSGPLLSVALDPEGEFFATSACDGTARIWQAASGKQIKSWPVAKACSDPALAASPCPLVWEPMAGRLLAMPFDCELRLLARGNSWPVSATCSSDQLRGPILCCVWSQQADFIAAGSRDGAISAWSIAWSDAPLREASLRQAAPYFALRSPGLCPVNQLCWWWRSPQAGAAVQPALVYLDAKGDIRTTEVRKNCSSRPLQQQQQQQQQHQKQLTDAELLAEAELADIDPRDLVDEFESEMMSSSASPTIADKKQQKGVASVAATTKEEDNSDSNADNYADDNSSLNQDEEKENRKSDGKKKKKSKKQKKKKKTATIGSDSSGSESSSSSSGSESEEEKNRRKAAAGSPHRARASQQRQRPLQPGSTSGCPRYLVWNRLGCVLEAASAMPDQPRILSVEFHDSALHHGLLIPNAHGFTLAALSLRLLALAAPSTAEALSFVRVRPLSGNDGGEYGGGAEWTQALPRGEDAVCLAASDNRLFAGSDRRTVRIWSHRGLQLAVLSAPGPLISLSAWPRGFAVIYNIGGGFVGADGDEDEDCPVAADLFEMAEYPTPGDWPVPRLMRSEVRIPLTARSRVAWLGHCQQSGSLCVQDSHGVVRAILPGTGLGAWCPVLNGRSVLPERTDWLWPVGVSLCPPADFRLAGVHCKNSAEPSALAARPPIRYYPLAPLLCPTPLSELESPLFMSASFGQLSGLGEQQLRLFAQALKSGEESRAVDAAAWMSERVLRLAIQYAVKAKRVKLVDRLTAMGEALIAGRTAGPESAAAAASPAAPVIQPTPVKRRKRESCEPSSVGK
ncbi:hypothetical protein BOX15_Mlig033329g2 [Macrostomum lignano]|uniref:Uncharacterized protein n=1 Tax=Macrostomum lignano TaxID=282301 RepID=A0A267H1D0_9PLAT|nr:hypothetical protein BOX15_Mlig033329g2 [Macrostomum lignano]